MIKFIVDKGYEKMTVGRYLRTYCSVSARTLAKLKRIEGGILLNGKNIRAIDPVCCGDVLEINLPSGVSDGVIPIKIALDIVFEDEYLVVINKPPYMPVHPTKVHQEDTLANGLRYYAEQRGEEYVFRAVNRLDRNTSGLVIIAKDRHTAFALSENTIIKKYVAFCHGEISEEGTVDAPITLSPDSKIVRIISPDGKPAITHYKPLMNYKGFTMIELQLETGRTHQIRCHMSYLGYPLLGDDLYGGNKELIDRQALHCGYICFTHPVTAERIEITSQLPEDMKGLIV